MRFITVNENNIITSIRTGKTIVENEMESEIGELGQQMLEDGTFVDVEKPYVEPQPTLEDKVDSLQDDVDYLILKTEGVI